MAVSTQLPHLADLVVHQILRFVPTKVAVRMMFVSKQWEGVWFLDPILDFDEGTGHYQHDHDQHEKFIKFVNNILKRYMEFCDQKQKHSAAKRFRLCMMSYLSGDLELANYCRVIWKTTTQCRVRPLLMQNL